MKCVDIHNHFQERGNWVDWENTTDTFKAGNPENEVNTIAVAWKPDWKALKQAWEQGADLFVAHESICVNAPNHAPGSMIAEASFSLPSEKSKFVWLERTGLVVYRCHNFWDRFPEKGIRWAWQKGLNLGGEVIEDNYPLLVTRIRPLPLIDLAKHILKKIRCLGQNGVLVTGNLYRNVSRVATGTGMTANPLRMIELGADVGILTDDGYNHARMGTHAGELDFPTIIVNHGVSEEWGVKNLAVYLAVTFPELNVFHIPQRCPYRIVTKGEGSTLTD